jgi:hypothetical protein
MRLSEATDDIARIEALLAAGLAPEEALAEVEREIDADHARAREEIKRTNRRLRVRERRHARAGERWFRREVRNRIQQRRRAARPVSCGGGFRREPGAQPIRRVGSRRTTGTSASSTDPPESDSSRLTPLLLGRAGR